MDVVSGIQLSSSLERPASPTLACEQSAHKKNKTHAIGTSAAEIVEVDADGVEFPQQFALKGDPEVQNVRVNDGGNSIGTEKETYSSMASKMYNSSKNINGAPT
ncbi:hypothetical protein V6N13_114136 [Hibiscus sabdariffa]|uniref:Uncharacterized protein n=1 Tax=Hibiscus sabdariffa TaxID=183260 RepID=A0ABR2U162_9ROSI